LRRSPEDLIFQLESHLGILTFARAVLPISSLRAIHFKLGRQPIQATPHFHYFSSELWGQSSIRHRRNQDAVNDYLTYIRNQYGEMADANSRIRANGRLLRAQKDGASFCVTVRPIRGDLWEIRDGFHRVALLAAANSGRVAVRIAF
jgi:hypothetical protein